MAAEIRGEKPIAVQAAVWSLSVSALITGIVTVRDPTLENIIATALLAVVAAKIHAGRNWARWLGAVLTCLGVAFMAGSPFWTPEVWTSMSSGGVMLAGLQLVLQVGAIVCAFLPSSSLWFRQKRIVQAAAL